MYVPPYEAILKALGTSRLTLNGTGHISVPLSLLKFLLQLALVESDFNRQGYLAANPDIADAVRRGELADPRFHYIGFGYFEGRRGATPPVDEDWYRRTYGDVAAAIRERKLASGQQHYDIVGAEELRAPDMEREAEAFEWKKVLGSS